MSTSTETLTNQEKLDIKAWRARERAMKLKGEDLYLFRENVKEMYEFSLCHPRISEES